MNPRLQFSLLFAASFLAASAQADVKLHGLFTDHMVLQRNTAVPVWGWAEEGERVTVEFRGQKVSTTAKDGRWMVKLKKLKAGGPEELKITGKNSITLRDVLVGEVWIASGQSNMEWPMRSTFDATNEIARTANPMVRLYTVPKLKADQPTNNVPSAWLECTPATTPGFSAVAYYFGRDLQKALGVPVGLIHTSWGGSPAEVWMREAALAADPGFKRDILDAYLPQKRQTELAVAAWEAEKAAAAKTGATFNKRKPGGGWKPCELYNGMIAPLIPYAIQGAIWYQGESNAGRAHQYRTLFAEMVRNWRRDWGQGDFTFLQVQLAPFKAIKTEPADSDWAELREAQNLAMKTLPRVGVAVITDVGEVADIHPRKKEPVGARLALAARGIAYGEKIVYSGPAYKKVKFKDGKAIVSFNHVGGGLVARAEPNPDITQNIYDEHGQLVAPLQGFTIAGADGKFFWASTEIQGDQIVVSSPQVPAPAAVRYGWADFPVVNLWNKDGLPASPFRTDDFPMITVPKKPEARK